MATSPTAVCQAAAPNNTLFVANLGLRSEKEVSDLFSDFSGFQRLRMMKPYAMPSGMLSVCALVEFSVSRLTVY